MIFDLFNKKKAPQPQPHQAQEGAFEKSRDLIKEATRLKVIDIEQAITSIRQAIAVCPDKVFDDYFKLANYIQLAGRPDESFGVFRKLLSELNPSDYLFFNMNMSTIDERMSLHLFKETKYKDCIWYGSHSDWNLAVALACQGRFKEYLGRQKFLDGRNAKKAFKELQLSDRLDSFKDAFMSIVAANEPQLHRLSDLSPFVLGAEPSQEFIGIFRSMNTGAFLDGYGTQLQPILETNRNFPLHQTGVPSSGE